jgi:hypothetical protein
LASNSISGKFIEKLHLNKTEEMNGLKLQKILLDAKKFNSLSIINGVQGSYLVNYNNNIEECMSQTKPIYIGAHIYEFAQIYMYDNIFNHLSYDKLIYTDTDSAKLRTEDFNYLVKKHLSKTIVPHWKEVEEYDPRYKTHKLYQPNSKVYGSFEDEYKQLNIKESFYLEKKNYLTIYEKDNKLCYKNVFKGIGPNDVFIYKTAPLQITTKITEDYVTFMTSNVSNEDNNRMRYYIYAYSDKLTDGTGFKDLYTKLYKDGEAFIMCQSINRSVKNTNRNVKLDETKRFNTKLNKLLVRTSIKKITIKQ